MTSRGPFQDKRSWLGLLRRIGLVTRKPELAEDLLHSAFIRLEEYRLRTHVENPAAFLVRTAANLSIDEGRREQVRAEVSRPIGDMIELHDHQPLQLEVLIARKRLERVEAGLAQLSPRTREIFLMHRIDGMKYREIAEALGVTVSAVEKHIAKAALFLTDWVEGW